MPWPGVFRALGWVSNLTGGVTFYACSINSNCQARKLQARPACAQRVAQCRRAAPSHACRVSLSQAIHQHQAGGFALGALAQAQELGQGLE